MGLLFDSLSTVERCRTLTDKYRESGGTGTRILVRRAWIGPPPASRQAQQVDIYRSYAESSAQTHWAEDALLSRRPFRARRDRRRYCRLAGCEAVNIRLHVPRNPARGGPRPIGRPWRGRSGIRRGFWLVGA